jgi:hypothetical protein
LPQWQRRSGAISIPLRSPDREKVVNSVANHRAYSRLRAPDESGQELARADQACESFEHPAADPTHEMQQVQQQQPPLREATNQLRRYLRLVREKVLLRCAPLYDLDCRCPCRYLRASLDHDAARPVRYSSAHPPKHCLLAFSPLVVLQMPVVLDGCSHGRAHERHRGSGSPERHDRREQRLPRAVGRRARQAQASARSPAGAAEDELLARPEADECELAHSLSLMTCQASRRSQPGSCRKRRARATRRAVPPQPGQGPGAAGSPARRS